MYFTVCNFRILFHTQLIEFSPQDIICVFFFIPLLLPRLSLICILLGADLLYMCAISAILAANVRLVGVYTSAFNISLSPRQLMLQTQTHSHTASVGRAKALSASLGRKMQSYTKHGLRARARVCVCIWCGAVCVYVFVHSAQPHQEWRNGAHTQKYTPEFVPREGSLNGTG
jgi:hypothetical protein